MKPEVSKDLILLVNSLKDFTKSKSVKYGNTKFDYVPLDDLLERIKQNDKWAVMQPLTTNEMGMSFVETVLIHESGEEVRSGLFQLLLNGNKMQDMGSVITYTKRYCLGAFLGISTEPDNDANNDSEVVEVMASDVQVKVIKQEYDEERIKKMLAYYKVDKLEKLTNKQALEVVNKIKAEKDKS